MKNEKNDYEKELIFNLIKRIVNLWIKMELLRYRL